MKQYPSLTVDCVILSNNKLVLIKRLNEPFKWKYALPWWFVEYWEEVETACKREIMEEIWITLKNLKLINVYSSLNRDPRWHTVSVAFYWEWDLTNMKAWYDAHTKRLSF